MHITRRYFLKSTGALAVYCGINPLRTLADVGLTAVRREAGDQGQDLRRHFPARRDGRA